MMQGEKLETGKDGGSLWTRPYVPRGAKKLGKVGKVKYDMEYVIDFTVLKLGIRKCMKD